MSESKAVGAGCELVRLASHRDPRGVLRAMEEGRELPFRAARVFFVSDVPSGGRRGGHAHETLTEVLVAVVGSVVVEVDDGREGETVTLDDPAVGLVVPPWVWCSQLAFSPGAVLLVVASHAYDPDDYIRDRAEWVERVRGR